MDEGAHSIDSLFPRPQGSRRRGHDPLTDWRVSLWQDWAVGDNLAVKSGDGHGRIKDWEWPRRVQGRHREPHTKPWGVYSFIFPACY